jgi:hypothetical protein
VFDRAEDDPKTSITAVNGGISTTHLVSSDEAANPSERRDGLAIAFECETCACPIIELTFAQHKGSTLVGWRYVSELAPEVERDAGERRNV